MLRRLCLLFAPFFFRLSFSLSNEAHKHNPTFSRWVKALISFRVFRAKSQVQFVGRPCVTSFRNAALLLANPWNSKLLHPANTSLHTRTHTHTHTYRQSSRALSLLALHIPFSWLFNTFGREKQAFFSRPLQSYDNCATKQFSRLISFTSASFRSFHVRFFLCSFRWFYRERHQIAKLQ